MSPPIFIAMADRPPQQEQPMHTPDPLAFVELAVKVEADEAHPALIEWYGRAGVESNLRAAIARRLSRLDRVDEHAPHRRQVKLIRLPSHGHAVLATLRTRADGRALRHVSIDARTFTLRSDDLHATLREMSKEVGRAFGEAPPERLRLYAHGEMDDPSLQSLRAFPGVPGVSGLPGAPYKRYLAGRLIDLHHREAPANADAITIRTPADCSFYPEYEQHYEEFWTARPDLKPFVRIESRDDLERYRAAGGLRLVEVDGQFAGVFAALPQTSHGLRGWCMHERILFGEFRGRRLGAAALWRFARTLPAEDNAVLYGTIVPDNQPSLRSAKKLGRLDIGGTWWLPTG